AIFGSDIWYTIYSKYFGYSIRLTPKSNRNEEYLPSGDYISNKFVCDYGNGKIDQHIVYLVNIFEEKQTISKEELNNGDSNIIEYISEIVKINPVGTDYDDKNYF